MSWEHIARKVLVKFPSDPHRDDPELYVIDGGQYKPITELEEQGYEMIALLSNQVARGLPAGIFKRFVSESVDL